MINTNEMGWDMPLVHFSREDFRAIRSLAESESVLCRWQDWDHGLTEDGAEEWVSLSRPDNGNVLIVRAKGGQCALIDEGEVVAEACSVPAVVDQAEIRRGPYV